MREIELTQGKKALVDDEDFDYLNQYHWYAHYDGYNWYACRHLERSNGKQPSMTMHREIIDIEKGMEIDHKDGNGLNNQKNNLRICTHGQNLMNGRPILGASRFKGVTWNKHNQKWKARISLKGQSRYLGCFESEVKAAIAYDSAAKKFHGEFARTNF